MMLALFLLTVTLRVPDAAQSVGQPKGQPVAGAELAKKTHDIAALLRCPVCQGMAVADSPAPMAVNMKAQVHELVARGYTEEQILEYFERSYGQFVLLRPKMSGMTSLVWLLPIGALLIGIFVVMRQHKRLSTAPATPAPAAADDDPYLAQVRALVGDK